MLLASTTGLFRARIQKGVTPGSARFERGPQSGACQNARSGPVWGSYPRRRDSHHRLPGMIFSRDLWKVPSMKPRQGLPADTPHVRQGTETGFGCWRLDVVFIIGLRRCRVWQCCQVVVLTIIRQRHWFFTKARPEPFREKTFGITLVWQVKVVSQKVAR